MQASSVGPTTRSAGNVALAGTAAFASACVAWQFIRSDLDWVHAPMSFYLLGAAGWGLQAAYGGLAAAVAALGSGYYRALPPEARSAAPLLLFGMAAVALVVTALARSNLPDAVPTLQGWVHGTAASTAFLTMTTGMLLQSWRLREAEAWAPRWKPAFALAMVCFLAMWLLALLRDIPRGAGQKVVIALIVAWLGLAAHWLRRAEAGGGSRTGPVERTDRH